MIKLTPQQKHIAQPLFDGYRPLRGLVHEAFAALLDIGLADLFVDNVARPQAAYLNLEFHFLAGAPSEIVAQKIRTLPGGARMIAPDAAWEPFIRGCFEQTLETRTRFAFGSGGWHRADLNQMQQLPAGFSLVGITSANCQEFAQLATSLVDWDEATQKASWQGWTGFGVWHEDRFVSGCAGTPMAGKVDVEVQTHLAFRRRGLATAAAAALINFCLDHDIEPCWDAANTMSVGLGQKLGFTDMTPYLVYIVPQS